MLSPKVDSELEAVKVAWEKLEQQTGLDNDEILPRFRLLHARTRARIYCRLLQSMS